MKKKDKRSELLNFFREKEKNKTHFTYAEAAAETGYNVAAN